MKYACDIHGDWDANRESACPACMPEARKRIAELEKEVISWKENAMFRKGIIAGQYMKLHELKLHGGYFSDCSQPDCAGGRDLINELKDAT